MRSVYIRPLNFLHGKDAQFHIQKKLAASVCGNKFLGFTKIEIVNKKNNKSILIDISQINKLKNKNKKQILKDLKYIQKKRSTIINLNNTKPVLMGVLNATPDSFSDGGKFNKLKPAIQHAKLMLEQGAQIIDIGGESTRPGAELISEQEECKRVIQIVKKISQIKKCIVSIDTRKSSVMQAAVKAGAKIINDVSALDFDSNSITLVAKLRKPIILNQFEFCCLA